jgi:hypothetical protein
MARPKIDIDPEGVFKLAQLGCSTKEIASYFDVSDDTINRNYAAEMDKGRDELRIGLRKLQLKAANNGNIAMLIWLGKQLLGQQDKAIIELTKIDDAQFVAEAQRRLISAGNS